MLSGPRIVAIFTLALALRLALVLWLHSVWGSEALLIEDSGKYRGAAEAGLRHADVMPAYIAFLRAFAALFDPSPLWSVLGQAVIDSVTCIIIAGIAATVLPRLAVTAGVMAALNPTQIVMASMVLTESLFLFFCALSLWAALAWLRRPGWVLAIAIGLALGLGILTRVMLLPWALVLPLLLVPACLILRRPVMRSLPQTLAGAIAGACLVLPIAYDNESRFGGFGLSSQGGAHALLWLVPLVMETVDGTPHAEGAAQMQARFAETIASDGDPFSRSRAMTAAASEALGELGPVPLAKAWAYGAAINLFSPAIILAGPVRTLPRTGFFATEGDSKLDKIVTFLFHNDNATYAWLLLIGAAGTFALRLGQARGLWRLLRSGDRMALASTLLLLAWIGFVLTINGPIASAKYRSPAEAAFVVLLAAGLPRRSGHD
jgi:4-amino-4-deoxy-L-arabinose transferase-like glycosyltransferase